MGLGYEALRAVNEHLVYLSITGFGSSGPLADLRVYDNLIQAVGGVAALQGGDDAPRGCGHSCATRSPRWSRPRR